MGERKRQNIWSAIGKLNIRDQIVLLVAVIVIGVVVAVTFLSALARMGTDTDFHITDSTLRNSPTAQVYKRATYTDFPYTVSFPGTEYVTTVGGEEHLYNDHVSSFYYDENQLLVLGVFDDSVQISEFYSYAIISAVDNNIDASTGHYTSMLHDEGYLNTLPLVYEGGKLSTSSDYYLVSYIYHTENGKNLLMMAITPKKEQKEINKSKQLIDKMMYSLSRVDEVSDVKNEEQLKTGSDSKPGADKFALDKNAEESMSTADKMDHLKRKMDEESYAIEYPDAVDLEYNILVSERIPKAVFYIHYEETDAIPKIAYLKSPTGAKYAPNFNNGNKIGLVYWEFDNPEEGTWLIHLSKNVKYGQFFAEVVSEDTFKQLFLDKDNPQPREVQ